MGTFIDRHSVETVSDEAFGRALGQADRQQVDAHGVLVLGHWLESKFLYCVLQAPKAEGVRENHADIGLGCDDVRQLDGVHLSVPLTPEDEQRVRASIATVWSHEQRK